MSDAITRVIPRELAKEWDLHYDAPGELHREEIDRHRWYYVELVVFTAPDDGQVYGVSPMRPLTEIQEDMDPWNDEPTVTLTRYESYEKTITAWRPVPPDDASARDAIDAQTLHDSPGADLPDEGPWLPPFDRIERAGGSR